MQQQGSGMQSVVKALRILETVAQLQPVGVGDLSRQLAMPKSTVQRCLLTLADAGWLRQSHETSGSWLLTAHAFSVGRQAESDLIAAAQRPLRRLRDNVDETVHLIVRDGSNGVVVDRVESTQTLRVSRPIGAKTPLHATAAGRAMLSLLPEHESREVLAGGLQPLTSDTVVDPDQLLGEVAAERRRGYSTNIRQNEASVCAVAAAVLDEEHQPIAAIVVSVPDSRFDERRASECGEQAVAAANETARNMGISAQLPVDAVPETT